MIRKSAHWLTLLCCASIPLSSFISVRLLMLLLLVSFFSNSQPSGIKRFFTYSWDIVLYLLVLIFGLLYSDDVGNGLRILETNFSFIAIAIILNRSDYVNEGKLYQLFYSFLAGLFVACLICLLNAELNYLHTGSVEEFFFYQLTSVISSHPTYLAYYLIFAITLILYLLFYKKTDRNLIWFLIGIPFFFLMLMLTGGKTAFISLMFVFAFFILKFLLDDRNQEKKITLTLIAAMILCMFIIDATESKTRDNILNDSWERLDLWKAAINANSNFLLGVGTGDHKAVLNQYLISHGFDDFARENYNSHNQFTQIFLSNGLLGLLAVIVLISRPIYMAAKYEHSLGILIMFPFLLYGMTEVFLGRYQGVVFVALLHQSLLSYYGAQKPRLEPKNE